ncbi:MAG: hypothetical protein CVV25_04890 [Ignavibacteriae bacterium HGW-Ignavibacteriae-4]|jgi:glycosyltransferase involved in cell wall biosynthesis|nr:MAG: hypothetical protein CVV25_04890 [Ignavibacteriae bacterium HGW-Ignavibacteriae-4]
MRILQLTPQFPFPPDDGGRIGIANIYYEFLEQGNDVDMVSMSRFPIKQSEIEKYKKNGNISIIEMDTKNTKFRVISYFLKNKSLYIEKQYTSDLINKIESLVDMSLIDVIHADHSNMARVALELSEKYRIPVGLRLHNIEYLIWKRFFEGLGKFNPKRVFIGQQYKLLKKLEAKFISDSDISFAITKEDKRRALELSPKANVVIASAGVDIEDWKPNFSVFKEPFSLVIATTFNWFHNVNAVHWFLDNVLPILNSKYPNVTLKIIGKNPPSIFDNYAELGANKLGYVDKVKPYFNSTQVYIAPLFVGGGIRIKILEALSMGLPVVATDMSAEGIDADESQGLIRANSIEEYSHEISKLFDDDVLRVELGKKARKFIEDNHTWKSNVKIMIVEYTKLVSSKKSKAL